MENAGKLPPPNPMHLDAKRRKRRDLSKAFLRDLAEAWEEFGPLVIRAAMYQNPSAFFNAMSRILPKEVMFQQASSLDDFQSELLEQLLIDLRAERARTLEQLGSNSHSQSRREAVGEE